MTCDTAWDSTPRLQAKDALAALVCLVALLNTVHRLNVIALTPRRRLPAGQCDLGDGMSQTGWPRHLMGDTVDLDDREEP